MTILSSVIWDEYFKHPKDCTYLIVTWTHDEDEN